MDHPAHQGRSGSVAIASLIAVAAAAVFGLPALFRLLHETWTQVYAAFAHGYLVLALAIWLGARNWRRNPPRSLEPFWPAAVPTIAVGVLIVALDNLGLGATRLMFLPALLWSAAWWVLGRDAARTLFIPAALLHFALPPWALLDRPLQWLTTQVVNFTVDVTSIPAYVEANYFHLPAGTFEIALGCSGLNYLITALALFSFQGAAYLDNWRDRARVLLVAGAVAVIANWIRVYLLIAVGHWTDMQHYLIRVEHHYFGWVLFAVLMWPVLNWAVSLEPRETNMLKPSQGTLPPGRSTFIAAAVAMIGLIGLRALTPAAAVTPPDLAALPQSLGGWTADMTPETAWQPQFEGASTSIRRYSSADASELILLRIAYQQQSADARLDAPQNNIAGARGTIEAEWAERLESEAGTLDAVFRKIRVDGRKILLWTVKAVGGIPYRTRLDGLLAELSPRKTSTSAVLAGVAAECSADCSQTHDSVRRAAATLLPELLIVDEKP
jgi:exosortase